MFTFVLPIYAVLSGVTMLLYALDKLLARLRLWRLPEAVLLGLGFLGGAPGALLGMALLRHKTRHLTFWLINSVGLVWQALLIGYLYHK